MSIAVETEATRLTATIGGKEIAFETAADAKQAHGAVLMLSPMPFLGPVGAVRIGRLDGVLQVNPTLPDLKDSELDLIVCGTPEAITMVEAGAEEVVEEDLIQALELAHAEIRKLCEL